MMNVGLVVYIYLKVVWQKRIYLGCWEWKLHVVCITGMTSCVAIFHPLDGFGCSGYWYDLNITYYYYTLLKRDKESFHVIEWIQFHDFPFRILNKPNTTSGIILGYYMCISTTVQAFCTCVGYRSIRNIIETQKQSFAHGNNTLSGHFRHHSIATQCLTTFVRIAEIIYCTLAIVAWAIVIQMTWGVEEPLTIFYTIVVTANSISLQHLLCPRHRQQLRLSFSHRCDERLTFPL